MLYNKYRPKEFSEVKGQDFVVETIKKAIDENLLAHSILLTGTHGTGKTSIARLIAKELKIDTTCIFEIDAASNNSVDDVRQLVTTAKIPPHVGKYKVYIIDEAHMYSNAAFNGLLKLMEEPPKHCYFILCTTEKSKIIPTILSRCQIFDLKPISDNEIFDQLMNIVEQEEIDCEEEALLVIVEEAQGSMRNALSLLELVKDNCTLDSITSLLEITSKRKFEELTQLIVDVSIDDLIIFLRKELNVHNVQRFLIDYTSYIRDLFYFKSTETTELVSLSDSQKTVAQKLFDELGVAFLFTILDSLNGCLNNPLTNNKAVILNIEIVLIKLILQRKKAKA